MAINSVTFQRTFFFFDRGRKTCVESSIKIFNVSYENKNFYKFPTEKSSFFFGLIKFIYVYQTIKYLKLQNTCIKFDFNQVNDLFHMINKLY